MEEVCDVTRAQTLPIKAENLLDPHLQVVTPAMAQMSQQRSFKTLLMSHLWIYFQHLPSFTIAKEKS